MNRLLGPSSPILPVEPVIDGWNAGRVVRDGRGVQEAIGLRIPAPVMRASPRQTIPRHPRGGIADGLLAVLRRQSMGHDARRTDGDG